MESFIKMQRSTLVLLILSWWSLLISKTLSDNSSKDDPLKFAKDLSHIKEHLMEQYGFDSNKADMYLKEYDAQTQYFIMHDYDKNRKLDGLELLKSMTHFHDHDEEHKSETPTVDNTETLVEFVDMILRDQDYNKDGYIDYPEYISYYSKYENGHND
ncbi:multiple coagulation factor deficiency protein 2 homolog isoform X1 [Hydra vulgaris]|uniref:Multiple coagulation factor deficiency protein 2 homolog isoform X1 n=2 Tax=Hydra vulgaris TaxID=6087 RepID=A0ABM4BXN1_HYDVU